MTVEVLQSMQEVRAARARLEARGLSMLGLPVGERRLRDRFLGRLQPKLGDDVKSWDVLTTAEFMERNFPPTARVLDLGAYCSEILCVLHRLGFARLTGVDLNERLGDMPFADQIRWQVANFLDAPFPDGAFDAVTSISVIEHGFDAPRLLKSVSRLLAPGGCFLASFDYWPQKIDTSKTKFFGMDWRIFSAEEVRAFIEQAREFGLTPVGGVALDATERPVSAAGHAYTFAWMALRKA
jgi:SAM-dependent methyltransferase